MCTLWHSFVSGVQPSQAAVFTLLLYYIIMLIRIKYSLIDLSNPIDFYVMM